jgi:hypothetical protein
MSTPAESRESPTKNIDTAAGGLRKGRFVNQNTNIGDKRRLRCWNIHCYCKWRWCGLTEPPFPTPTPAPVAPVPTPAPVAVATPPPIVHPPSNCWMEFNGELIDICGDDLVVHTPAPVASPPTPAPVPVVIPTPAPVAPLPTPAPVPVTTPPPAVIYPPDDDCFGGSGGHLIACP